LLEITGRPKNQNEQGRVQVTQHPQKNVVGEERKGKSGPNATKILTKTIDETESVDIVRKAISKIATAMNSTLTALVEDRGMKTETAEVEQGVMMILVMIGDARVCLLELQAPLQVAALFQTMKVNGSSRSRLPHHLCHFQHHPPQQRAHRTLHRPLKIQLK